MPIRTREAVAACAALDLTYWCDHSTNLVWAVDDNQRFHTVRLDRKTGVSSHNCFESGKHSANGALIGPISCGDESGRSASWVTPDNTEEVLALLGSGSLPAPDPWISTEREIKGVDVSHELGVTGHCTVGRHQNCKHGPGNKFPDGIGLSDGTRYLCPCDCHREGAVPAKKTAADKRAIKALAKKSQALADKYTKPREVTAAPGVPGEPMAVTMIRNNPAAIPSLHIDYLRMALGHTPYDAEINEELQRREAS